MIPIARKVLQDTLNASQLNCPPIDPLHQAAADELLQMADELKISDHNLCNLTRQQIDRLLDRILERDQFDDAMINDDTKAFKILKEEEIPAAPPIMKKADLSGGTT
jgi:hypothetical protein